MFKVYRKNETKLDLVKIDNVIREWFVKTIQSIGGEIRHVGPIDGASGVSYYSATIDGITHNIIAKLDRTYTIFATNVDVRDNNKVTRMNDSIRFTDSCVVVSSARVGEFEDSIITMIYDAFVKNHPETPDMDFYNEWKFNKNADGFVIVGKNPGWLA